MLIQHVCIIRYIKLLFIESEAVQMATLANCKR